MKRPVFLRLFPWNRLTFPLLLHVWERAGLDRQFAIRTIATGEGEDPLPLFQEASLRPGDPILYSFMTPHLPLIAAELKRLRTQGFSPLCIAGGPHVSGEQELAAAIGLDVLCPGPGEETFRRLGEDLADGNRPLAPAYVGPERPDAFDSHIPVSRYFRSIPPLEIMRGCFWKCRFCQTGSQRPRFRGEASIVEYLSEIKRRGFRRVTFISPSALEYGASAPGRPSAERLESLLSLASSQGIRFVEYGIFPSEVRAGGVSAELLHLLRRHVSNRCLTIGAQSGLDRQLRLLKRGHGTAAVREAVEMANACGFSVNLDFIFALPGEGEEERRSNLEFIMGLQKKGKFRVHLHHFFPLAGSGLADRLPSFLGEEDRGRLLDLRRWGVATDWWVEGEKRVRAYFDWLKREHPSFYERYH